MKRNVKISVFCLVILLLAVSVVYALDCPLTQSLNAKNMLYKSMLSGVGINPAELEFAIQTGTIKEWRNISGAYDLIVNTLKGTTEGHIRVCTHGTASNPDDARICDTWFIDNPGTPPIGLKIRMAGDSGVVELVLHENMTTAEIEAFVIAAFQRFTGIYKDYWVAAVMDALIKILQMRGIM